jgi:glyoxylase-like metal-dependent hydrolase (beta-lactamase superfamily II)
LPVVDLGDGIYQIDVYGMGLAEYTSAYLVQSNKIALIETGATPGIKHLFSAFQQLDISLDDIDYVIVTHVHLDHSGGAGALLQKLPKAKVFVHPRGARHLNAPARLCQAVRTLYGEVYDQYFEEVVPIEEDRIYSPADGEKLDLGKGREFAFYYTLGHARHHMVIYDTLSKGLFSGDTLGVWYRLENKHFVFPVTPPPEFDPDDCLATCRFFRQLLPECIYFSHFGKGLDVFKIISRYEELVQQEVTLARQVISGGGTLIDLKAKIWELMLREISRLGLKEPDSSTRKRMSESLTLSAQGIFTYLGQK